MSDCMDYPQTLRKFANDYSFKDREEVYTNGSMLVPLFRIEQALDEHFMDIEKKQYKMDTDSAYECGYQKGRADAIDDVERKLLANGFITTHHALDVWHEIAEQLKEQTDD